MKKKLSVTLVLLLALAFCVSMAGCAGQAPAQSGEPASQAPESSEPAAGSSAPAETADKTIKIGISMHTQENEFVKKLADAMVTGCEKLEWEYMMTDAQADPNKQITQIETLLTSEVDGVLIVPVDKDAIAASVEKINEAKIPCVVVNMIVNTDKFDAYVGSNDVTVGEDITKWIADKLGSKGNIVVMEGKYGFAAQAQRTQGIQSALANLPDINVLTMKSANWSREEAMTLMENWLQTYGDQIDAVIAENDEMGLGAMRAIMAHSLDKKILVAGIDGLADAMTAIKDGTYDCTFLQDAAGQGQGGVDVMAKILNGEDYEKELWIPFQTVTAENVGDYLK